MSLYSPGILIPSRSFIIPSSCLSTLIRSKTSISALILARDKFVDEILVTIAHAVIYKAAKLVTGSEVVEKEPKVQAIKGVGESLGRGTAAKKLLEDIKVQEEELEQIRMSIHVTFTSHFAGQPEATKYVEDQEKEVIRKVRKYGLELLDCTRRQIRRP
jgi:hypothetical protein